MAVEAAPAKRPGHRFAWLAALVVMGALLGLVDDFLRDKILSLGLVSNIESRIVIRAVKNSTAVPLGLISSYVGVRA